MCHSQHCFREFSQLAATDVFFCDGCILPAGQHISAFFGVSSCTQACIKDRSGQERDNRIFVPPSRGVPIQGLQLADVVEVSGLVHSGPRPVLASGRLIIATGPDLCSPLNGFGFVGSKPQSFAALGSSNQKPT
jgi:hypothetical protein